MHGRFIFCRSTYHLSSLKQYIALHWLHWQPAPSPWLAALNFSSEVLNCSRIKKKYIVFSSDPSYIEQPLLICFFKPVSGFELLLVAIALHLDFVFSLLHIYKPFWVAEMWALWPAMLWFTIRWLDKTVLLSLMGLQTSHLKLFLLFSQWYVPLNFFTAGS